MIGEIIYGVVNDVAACSRGRNKEDGSCVTMILNCASTMF